MKSLTSSRNLVGGDEDPKNLHAYGDCDGKGIVGKLQHPLGVHFVPEKNVILVTDTYNHKIKVVDPFKNEIFTWLGGAQTDVTSLIDGHTFNSAFNEPSGISSLYCEEKNDVKIYICDTNNHCIRKLYYDIGNVTTPDFSGITRCETELMEKQPLLDISPSKKTPNPNQSGETNLVCEGGVCYPKE
jgi:hypothetical protein